MCDYYLRTNKEEEEEGGGEILGSVDGNGHITVNLQSIERRKEINDI